MASVFTWSCLRYVIAGCTKCWTLTNLHRSIKLSNSAASYRNREVISKKCSLVFLFPSADTNLRTAAWWSPSLSVANNLWAKRELTVTSASLQSSLKHPVFDWGRFRVSLFPWDFLKCVLVHLGHKVRNKMVEWGKAWLLLFYTSTWNHFMLYEKL